MKVPEGEIFSIYLNCMEKKQEKQSSLAYIFDFYQTLRLYNITLVYEGEITDDLTRTFTSMAENNMLKEENSGLIQKRVFYVMVECLQNLTRHADKMNTHEGLSTRGVFIVTRDKDEYRIITGNYIENVKITALREKLEYVNSLSREQLRKLYLQQLNEGTLSEKGGAGLGFIDIARKTGRKIEYYFHPVDDKQSFFIMTSVVPRSRVS